MKSDSWETAKEADESGFFDLPKTDYCTHPEHNPPMHLVIPRGKGYRHVCPACGNVVLMIPPDIRY